ncbi:MAG: 2-dehydropantoate 2-reductase [Steroidobacteraceae bacterium]
MRLLVVGAGSTGGYFGARLAQAGRDVTFLVRRERAALLRANGLQILSPHGDLTLSPNLVTAGEIASPYDVVLLTVKAFSLEAAMNDMASAVGAETVILPVLNGMRHVDILRGRFGPNSVAGCVCIISSNLDEQGRIVQLTRHQSLAYGEFDGAPSARMQKVDAFMQGAGFEARLSAAIAREMWEKWILLASLGGITCLMRGSIGEIEAAPGGRQFARRFLEEVVSIVRRVGSPPSESFLETAAATLTTPGSPLTSSMYRDLQKGGAIEADQIIGDLLARGREQNIDAPLLAAAYTSLSMHQRRSANPRAP